MQQNTALLTDVYDEKAERYAAILFCAMIAFSMVSLAARTVLGNSISRLFRVFMYVILAVLAVKALPQILRVIQSRDIIFFLLAISTCLLSMLFNRYHPAFIQVWEDALINCVPMYFVALSIRDYTRLLKYLHITAYVIAGCGLLTLAIGGANVVFIDGKSYSQYFGYNTLPATMIFLASFFKRFDFRAMIGFAVTCFMVLFAGARGPLVCILGFAILLLIFGNKTIKSWKTIVWIAACVTIAVAAGIYFEKWLEWLIAMFNQLGVNSRVLMRLRQATFLSRTGREGITSYVLSWIKENPLIGCGVVQDRILIQQHVYYGTYDATSTYPHNIYLELIMQFGAVVGSILSICIMRRIILAIKYDCGIEARLIVLILIGIGLLPLMASSSYLIHPSFYMLMGVCTTICRQNERAVLPAREFDRLSGTLLYR